MTSIYNKTSRKKLSQRISEINDREKLIKLNKIIAKHCRDLNEKPYTRSSDGVILYFDNMDDNLLKKIFKYVDTHFPDEISIPIDSEFNSEKKK